MAKKILTPEAREFAKVKRFIQKRFPGAYTIRRADKSYAVVDGEGISIVDEELLLPPAPTIREAWRQAKYTNWFSNMIRKSANAFDESKVYTSKRGDRSTW